MHYGGAVMRETRNPNPEARGQRPEGRGCFVASTYALLPYRSILRKCDSIGCASGVK